MKISVIGAGNVGATLAMRIVESGIGDVVLVDVVEGLANGKALDISDAAPIMGHEKSISGTTDYKEIEDSDVVVITAGFPRKPGMSREDLISKNIPIMDTIVKNVKSFCKDAIIIVVTNPLDVISHYIYKSGSFPKEKVIGMAGTLDASRFSNLIAEELSVPRRDVECYVLGSHGDTMVPVVSKSSVNGEPLRNKMNEEAIQRLTERTKKRGAEIVANLKMGSACYSPSAGVLEILRAISNDSGNILCVSTLLEGEYGISGCFLGVPAHIGKAGILEIVQLELEEGESKALKLSAEKTKHSLRSVLQ
ncbi:MAG: malate dehydrogenase [Candidatus Omnitrophica bacterium]|nr:malate dehydrogenase [Candidatus Omnitrophota bacterium]